MPVGRGEAGDPADALAEALIDSGGQMSVIVNHTLSSTPVEGEITTDSGPIQSLRKLLSETFAQRRDRPSAKDLNTAVRVILWASEVTAEEIFLVTPEFLEELGGENACSGP